MEGISREQRRGAETLPFLIEEMTVTTLEPTPYLRMEMAELRTLDFSWALDRTFELIVETAGIGPARIILSRLLAENETRRAQSCVDSTPPCE